MKLVIFRHAEKQSIASSDPDLSSRGFSQAHQIADQVRNKKISTPHVILASPRRRTTQTLQKVADDQKIKIQVKDLLDQRKSNESSTDFRKRIQEFLITLHLDYPTPKTIFICTHIDWIEEFMSIVESSTDLNRTEFHHFQPAQWVEFEKNELWDMIKAGTVVG